MELDISELQRDVDVASVKFVKPATVSEVCSSSRISCTVGEERHMQPRDSPSHTQLPRLDHSFPSHEMTVRPTCTNEDQPRAEDCVTLCRAHCAYPSISSQPRTLELSETCRL